MTARPFLRALACAAVLTLAPGVAHAATITSTTFGDWSDPATWAGGVVPATGDTAKVKSGNSVTLTGDVTVTGSTEFSGPLRGDPEASSLWTNSTFTQNYGGVTFSGHRLTGALEPVLNDADLTVRGVNDLGGRPAAHA